MRKYKIGNTICVRLKLIFVYYVEYRVVWNMLYKFNANPVHT